MDITKYVLESAVNSSGNVNKTEELIQWISELNKTTYIRVEEKNISKDSFWFYDDYNGEILNRKRSFFSIKGVKRYENEKYIGEQPMIMQPEIGYLGIVCKVINGVLNFLMQAKIEPGNINCVQISPTIQATKSNFTRMHGGALPAYFDLFEGCKREQVIYDQIQSEQAARFYKKRNRNMIILANSNVKELPNFKWMTLGQIKELMKIDNLVNMDTRTVLSGLPYIIVNGNEYRCYVEDDAIFQSLNINNIQQERPKVLNAINDYKMFQDVRTSVVPLYELSDWNIDETGITCDKQAPFMVRFYEIEIEGREVRKWSQPLFKAIGKATFGLVTAQIEEKRKYLIKMKPEFGTFDKIEIGPTIQWEPTHSISDEDSIERLFRYHVENNIGVKKNVVLSEEGGRFYHEQNDNIIVEVSFDELTEVPDEYFWVSYSTLYALIQNNNVLNIQLRNLMSLLDF